VSGVENVVDVDLVADPQRVVLDHPVSQGPCGKEAVEFLVLRDRAPDVEGGAVCVKKAALDCRDPVIVVGRGY